MEAVAVVGEAGVAAEARMLDTLEPAGALGGAALGAKVGAPVGEAVGTEPAGSW